MMESERVEPREPGCLFGIAALVLSIVWAVIVAAMLKAAVSYLTTGGI